MNEKLLFIASGEFPPKIGSYLSRQGFECFEARGRLKVKEICAQKKVTAILWYFEDYDLSLAQDLIDTLNLTPTIPVLLITKDFERPEVTARLNNPLLFIEEEDAIKSISRHIRQVEQPDAETSGEEEQSPLFEIDFKNAVRQITRMTEEGVEFQEKQQPSVSFLTPWTTVDNKEKKILSNSDEEAKPPIFNKVKGWLNKEE